MPLGRPRLTVTLSVRASAVALKRCAETGDQPGDYVDDLVMLDCDERVGYFDGFEADVADDIAAIETDLSAVAAEMEVPS